MEFCNGLDEDVNRDGMLRAAYSDPLDLLADVPALSSMSVRETNIAQRQFPRNHMS